MENQGTTNIEELLRSGTNTRSDNNMVDSILEEINTDKHNELVSNNNQQALEQKMMQQKMMEQKMIEQKMIEQKMMEERNMIEKQQSALENLIHQNQHKDKLLQEMSNQNENKNENKNDNMNLLYEFKDSLIIFSLLIVLTQPIINNYIVKMLGIEYNTIYAILRTFIITIIFFLINKFI